MLFHPLHTTLPVLQRMNDPFNYTPDPLSHLAAEAMQRLLPAHPAEGKMVGVLIVERDGQIGYLQAFSGQTDWPLPEGEFVPPVFDYLRPEGYFKQREAEIVRISRRIVALKTDERYQALLQRRRDTEADYEKQLLEAHAKAAEAKARRDQRRTEGGLSKEEKAEMIRESQFQKGEIRRLRARFKEEMRKATAALTYYERELRHLTVNRKRMSEELQAWLFAQFRMRNAEGKEKDLLAIFDQWHAEHLSPKAQRHVDRCPSGAGECCEPKLLQYAYLHHLRPRSLAMLWWGPSPKEEVRHHGQYYPACQLRCRPILTWMMQGLDAEVAPVAAQSPATVRVLYEDADLAVIDKPTGLLSVPGKDDAPSVLSVLASRWPDEEGPYSVHRLDCFTSGLMVVARTKKAQRKLQAQFAHRTTHKEYTALCQYEEHLYEGKTGEIDLPLAHDYCDLPRMLVDFRYGKPAHTRYQVLRIVTLGDGNRAALLRLTPTTGRTHQLRVHCAHAKGLNAPIIGDPLYGQAARRMCLHATLLEFDHPSLHQRMRFHSDPPFIP